MAEKVIIYKSAYSKKEKIAQESGNMMQDVYGYEINSKGQRELVKTGEKNLYEEIQAQAEDCRIENILKRVAIGDMSDFRPDGIYQDISEIPNNLIQAKREMQKMENIWMKLPNEIKSKYGFSVEQFIAEAGSKDWLINMGYIVPEEPKIEEQPKEVAPTKNTDQE